MNLPANNDVTTRLYWMPVGLFFDFNNLYDNDVDFRQLIQSLQTMVQENGGGPFSGLVTPENTPGRGGTGGNGPNDGGGGNAPVAN